MMRRDKGIITILTTLVAVVFSVAVHAATITVINLDGAGEGFNDPTPATPIGGNNGTTVGAQRLIAYQKALELWGKTLKSDVDIVVQGSFRRLNCTATGGTLAQAGALQIFANFPNAPLQGHCSACSWKLLMPMTRWEISTAPAQ